MRSSVAAGVNTSRTKQRAETRVVAAAIIAILQCALQSYMMKASLSRENGLPRIVPEYVLPSHTGIPKQISDAAAVAAAGKH